MTVSRKPLTDFKRELITPTAARSQTAVQEAQEFCCVLEAAVISEVSRAVLGTTEVTTNSSFMSEMASRALETPTHTQMA